MMKSIDGYETDPGLHPQETSFLTPYHRDSWGATGAVSGVWIGCYFMRIMQLCNSSNNWSTS